MTKHDDVVAFCRTIQADAVYCGTSSQFALTRFGSEGLLCWDLKAYVWVLSDSKGVPIQKCITPSDVAQSLGLTSDVE